MDPTEKEWRELRKCRLFASAGDAALNDLRQSGLCHTEVFQDGACVLSPGHPKKTVGVILCGKAIVATPDPDRESLLRFLKAGDVFGIANLFTDSPFVSVIRASGTCRVLFLPEQAIRTLITQDETFLFSYLAFLSGRIGYLNQKIGYLTAGSAERRLSRYLGAFNATEVILPDSLSSLSELLGLGRASLYRAFDRLEEDHYIRKDGKTIFIPSPDALKNAYRSERKENTP